MAKRRTKRSNAPKRGGNNGIRLFVLVMLIVLLLGVIGGSIYLGIKSDGFRNWDFIPGISDNPSNPDNPSSKFDVQKDGKSVKSVESSSDVIRIDVINGGDFTVIVRPKASADFDFMLDGSLHAFAQADGDYNRAFDLKIEDDYFTFTTPLNIVNSLNDAYFGHVISDVRCNYVGTFFEVVVTAESGETKKFDVTDIYATAIVITLDKSEVTF